MSHITYHYLYNGDQLQGNYLYDVTHLPNKKLQEKIYKKYTDGIEFRLKTAGALDLLEKYKSLDTLEDRAHFLFSVTWNNQVKDVLGKPYPGLWGIYTTPADLFDDRVKLKKDSTPLRYRVKLDCDMFDPDVLVIRVGRKCYKYNIPNWNKYCKPYVDDKEMTIKTYNKNSHLAFKIVPQIIFYVPKLKFNKSQFEEAIPQ